MEFKQWFKANAIEAHEDPNWATKFLITTSYLWKWRCKAYFDNMEDVIRDKGRFLESQFNTTIRALDNIVHLEMGAPRQPEPIDLV